MVFFFNRDWATFCEAMADPVTKLQFVTLCQKLMSHVKESAMTYLLPALMKMLEEDPQQFLSVQENIQRVEPACSRPKSTVGFIEDEHDVVVIKDGVLTRIISKAINICCFRTSSHPSLSSKTRSQCTLLQQLGITKEQVQTNVEETLRTLGVMGSAAGSESLSADIAKEVVMRINSTLVERKHSVSLGSDVSAIRLTKSVNKLIEDVSLKMNGNEEMPVKVLTTGQISSSQTAIHSSLTSAMGGAIKAVINHMESYLVDNNKNTPAKRWLDTIKKVLICQCSSLNICSMNAKDLTPEQIKKAVSTEEFRDKAKKAVSDVRIRKDFNSSPSTDSSLHPSDIATSHGRAVENICDLPVFCYQLIEETAASVIETFVATMKMTTQSSKDITKSLSNDEAELRTSTDTLVVDNRGRAGKVQIAATKIYMNLKMVLKDFFGHLQISGLQAHCNSDPVLPLSTALSSVELRTTHSNTDFLFNPYQLDSCTKNVLKAVLSACLPGKGQDSPLPSANRSLEDNLLFRLSDMASSSFSFFTEDDFQKYSSTLTEDDVHEVTYMKCLKRLYSVEFQMNAFEAVIGILVTSVQSHISLQSSPVNEMDALPWAKFTSKDLDLVAADIVDQFLTDMKMSTESLKQSTKDNKCSLENKQPETHAAGGSGSTGTDDIVTSLTEVIQKLFSDNIKTRVTKDVCHVLLQTAQKIMGQSCSLAVNSTASDVVVEVVGGIQTLLDFQSSDTMDQTTLDAKGNKERVSLKASETTQKSPEDLNVIWTTCLKMLEGLQGKVLDFFTKCQQVGTELKCNTNTYAKKVISAVLICIKKGLPKSKGLDRSVDVEMITDILNAMLKNIGVDDDQELTPVEEIAASSSSHSNVSGWSENSDKVLPVSISELTADGTIIKHTYIDMSDHNQCGLPAGISRETIEKIVKTVNEKLDLEQVSGSSSQHGDLHSIAVRLDKSLSSSSLSDDLTGRVYGLFKKSSRRTMSKSTSDTELLNAGKGEVMRKRIASQFVHTFAEETLKHFLLPCFKLPSPYKEKPDSLVPASASASQILTDLLNLLIEAMVKDVMANFSQSDIYREDHAPQAKERRGIRRGILRFLPKIPKVKIFSKKTKSAADAPSFDNYLNKNMTDTDIVSESTVPVPLCQTPSTSGQSEEEHQAKNCFPFMRLVTALRRRK